MCNLRPASVQWHLGRFEESLDLHSKHFDSHAIAEHTMCYSMCRVVAVEAESDHGTALHLHAARLHGWSSKYLIASACRNIDVQLSALSTHLSESACFLVAQAAHWSVDAGGLTMQLLLHCAC